MLRVCFLFFSLLVLTTTTYALPFTIIPKAGTQLPTSVPLGGSVDAFYTVTNNTQAQRNSNFVKYLPPNTVQVTGGSTLRPDTCGPTFNLAGTGKVGSSCTLQLRVSGPVNGNDPDPHHHLFVCFPGGTTCAGTNFPLNVEAKPNTLSNLVIAPSTVSLFPGQKQQFNATAVFTSGSTQDVTALSTWNSTSPAIASISASGLATALAQGTSNITATFNSVTSTPAMLTVTGTILTNINISPTSSTIIAGLRTQQYLAIGVFNNGTSQDITASATWASSNPTIATIAPGGLATGLTTGTTNVSASLNSVSSNNAVLNVNAVAYIPNGASNTVLRCRVNANGTLASCGVVQSGFAFPIIIRLSMDHTLIYVLNNNEGSPTSSVSICPLNDDGTIGLCNETGTGLSGSAGMAFNAAGTQVYITNNGSDSVSLCDVQSNGQFANCTQTITGLDGVQGITINSAGTNAYIANEDHAFVSRCPISNTGSLGPCVDATTPFVGFDAPHSVTFDATGTRVYITNFLGNYITQCNVNNIGNFTGCTNLPLLFNSPNDLVFNRDFTKAYIVGLKSNMISICDFNSTTGAFSNCKNAGANGLNFPASIVLP